MVMTHAAEVAQVITSSKQQAAQFEHKPPTPAAAAGVTAASQKPDVLPSSTDANPSQQAAATAVGDHATAVGSLATDARDNAGTSATQLPLRVDAEQQPQQQEVPSQAAVSAPAIKPKTLKPITLARGSSAFSMSQAKRPALAQGVAQTQPASATHPEPLSNSATPSHAVLTHPVESQAVSLDQAAPLLVIDAPDVQVSANRDIAQSQAAATTDAAAASAFAAPATTASEQPFPPREQNPSAMGPAISNQHRAIPQIRTAAGGLFGAAQPRAPALVSQPAQRTAAASFVVGNGPQPQEPDVAAVQRLRAQFTLPFAVAPAERQPAAPKAGKRQQPEGHEPLGEARGPGRESSPAEGIRAVVDALQAEKPCDGVDAVHPVSKKQKGTARHYFCCYKSLVLLLGCVGCSM